jgi:hypothetical protein
MYGIVVADLDGDGDLDFSSPDTSPANVWVYQNKSGSARHIPSGTSPNTIKTGTETGVMPVAFTHNGIPADLNLELRTWNLHLLASDCATPLTTPQATALLSNLRVRLDDGDVVFETSDTLVAEVTSFSLASGVQTVNFTPDDANVAAIPGQMRQYFISLTPLSAGQICVKFDPDADALVEANTPHALPAADFSVTIEDSSPASVLMYLVYENPMYLPLVLK